MRAVVCVFFLFSLLFHCVLFCLGVRIANNVDDELNEPSGSNRPCMKGQQKGREVDRRAQCASSRNGNGSGGGGEKSLWNKVWLETRLETKVMK